MGKNKDVSRPKTRQKPAKKPSKPSQPSFTLIMSTLACLALLVGLYYTNKSANIKANQKAKSKSTQENTQGFHPTVKSSSKSTHSNDKVENSKKEREQQNDQLKQTSEDTSRTKPVAKGKRQIRDKYPDFKILPRLDGKKVGHVQNMELEPGKFYKVETKSLKPPIFEIPEFLTPSECQQIIDGAKRKGLETSFVQDQETDIKVEPTNKETFTEWDYNKDGVISTLEVMHNLIDLSDLYFSKQDIEKMFEELNVDQNGNGVMDLEEFLHVTTDHIMNFLHKLANNLPRVRSRNSKQTWVDHTVVEGLDERVAALTKLPFAVIEGSEKLQVVNYGREGHYHCHHDSQDIEDGVPCCYEHDKRYCRLCRYITILYFLNDVEEGGETAFPVANNETFSIEAWADITKYRCDLSKHCHKANLYVQPQKGKAIMWYNHFRDDKTGWVGNLDPTTYHGGCDIIRGRKWIANNWINIMGKSRDKMVSHTNHKKRI